MILVLLQTVVLRVALIRPSWSLLVTNMMPAVRTEQVVVVGIGMIKNFHLLLQLGAVSSSVIPRPL